MTEAASRGRKLACSDCDGRVKCHWQFTSRREDEECLSSTTQAKLQQRHSRLTKITPSARLSIRLPAQRQRRPPPRKTLKLPLEGWYQLPIENSKGIHTSLGVAPSDSISWTYSSNRSSASFPSVHVASGARRRKNKTRPPCVRRQQLSPKLVGRVKPRPYGRARRKAITARASQASEGRGR